MSFLMVDSNGSKKPEKGKLFGRGQTSLSKGMTDQQEAWLLDYIVAQWHAHHAALSGWRNKLGRFERLADDNFSDRSGAPNPEKTDAPRSIFERQNHTLGLVSGKADQVFAQAKDDIFGTRPWLAATPQGEDDTDLAERITKHSQWKFDQSNLEPTLIDAVALAAHLGTAFPKLRWVREIEEFERAEYAAHSKKTKKPLLKQSGDYVTTDEELAELIFTGAAVAADVEWKELLITETVPVFNNIEAAVLDWKDVAFDPVAPELNLRYTPFFSRFKMGVYDLVAQYEMTDDQRDDLLAAAQLGADTAPREHRGETDNTHTAMSLDPEANPEVFLVEGFIRCDPFNTGKPVRLHVIFSPELHALFRCDYLANVTPGGLLPVFPVRCFKVPRRIIGKGYWERFEDANDAIDGLYNATTLRNRQQADVFKSFNRSALASESEGEDVVNHPEKIFELKPDKTIDDVFGFKVMPDASSRTDQLLQQMLQMANVRMGTSSASQGQLTGIPENDTATGSKINAGRAIVLDKAQIAQMMTDFRLAVEFAVHLLYANQDTDETFVWGEGKDAELLQIKAGDVKGLRANVTLTLTQSDNLQRLESARQAIDIAIKYLGVPEPDKPSLRRLFTQAISAMGFNDADRIIREGVVDPAGILALLPPDMQPVFTAFLQAQGMLAPPGGEGAAPVEAGAPPPAEAPVTAES